MTEDYVALLLSTIYFALLIIVRKRYLKKYCDVNRIAVLGVAMYSIIALNGVYAALIFFNLFSENVQLVGGSIYFAALIVFLHCLFWEVKRTHKSKYFDGRFRIS